MSKAKLLFIITTAVVVIIINAFFVYLGFEIFKAEKELAYKRINAYQLSILDLISKKLNNLISGLEKAALSKITDKTNLKDLNKKIKDLKESNPLVERYYVLPHLHKTTDSLGLNEILSKYYERVTNKINERFFEISHGKYYAVDIIKPLNSSFIVVLVIDLKQVLNLLKKRYRNYRHL